MDKLSPSIYRMNRAFSNEVNFEELDYYIDSFNDKTSQCKQLRYIKKGLYSYLATSFFQQESLGKLTMK